MPMSIPMSTSISNPESHTTTIGSCQQTNIPFINKYQPQYFANFEQLDPNIVLLLNTLIKPPSYRRPWFR